MTAPRPAPVAFAAGLCLCLAIPFAPIPVPAVFAAAPAASGFARGFRQVQDDEGVEQAKAKKLAGSVHMALAGSPLALVLIEECDPTFSKVLSSTHTDHYGNFELKPGRRGKVHYLRLSAKGFETREYEVTLVPDAPDTLKLELQLTPSPQSLPARRRPSARVFDS